MELVSDNFGDVWFVFSTQQELFTFYSPSIGAAQEHLSPLAWYCCILALYQEGV